MEIRNNISITEEYFISPYNEKVNATCMERREARSVLKQMSLVLEEMKVDLVHRKKDLTCS